MINPFKEINWNPDTSQRKKFALSLIIGFPVIAVILLGLGWLKSGHWDKNINLSLWVGIIGFAIGLILFLIPKIAKPFYLIWYFIGACIGIVVSNTVMVLFFYIVLTPIGILRRLFSKDFFSKNFDRTKNTYWKDASRTDDVKRYYKQF